MPLYLASPFDREVEPDAASLPPRPAIRHSLPLRQTIHRLPRLAADLFYLLVKAGAFLGAIYLAVLGLPLLFFLALVGGDMTLFFTQLGNLSAHYLAADHASRASFAAVIKLVLLGLATFVVIWRLPRFLDEVSAELASSGEEV